MIHQSIQSVQVGRSRPARRFHHEWTRLIDLYDFPGPTDRARSKTVSIDPFGPDPIWTETVQSCFQLIVDNRFV